MAKATATTATEQAVKVSPLTGTPPPVERQFGKPNGNPRNPGGWKKEDTARFKLERMLELSEQELVAIAANPDAPLFERRIARNLIKDNDWKITEGMLNQVYGQPKQRLEVEPIQPKPLIDLTEDKKRG